MTDNRTMDIAKEVDARGLNCPLPILKAKKALAELQSGELLKVLSTDAGSVRDFQAFAKQTGNELVEQGTEDEVLIHVLRRRLAAAASRSGLQRPEVLSERRAHLRVL